jgi:hypothetical protein
VTVQIDRPSPRATFSLFFDGKSFAVPKKSLFELFEQRRDLFETTSYAAQSSVPLGIFETFVESLSAQRKISATKENAVSLLLLAREFFLPELATECATFSVPVDQFSILSDRVCQLELLVSSFSNPPSNIAHEVEYQERGLESLRFEVEAQRGSFQSRAAVLVLMVDELERDFQKLRGEVSALKRGEKASPSPVELAMKEAKSLDGIISYLTKKHGGNIHEKGIVRTTSKSGSFDFSEHEPGQWVCWDCREMRVRPTNYTILSSYLKSWVLEGSLAGA